MESLPLCALHPANPCGAEGVTGGGTPAQNASDLKVGRTPARRRQTVSQRRALGAKPPPVQPHDRRAMCSEFLDDCDERRGNHRSQSAHLNQVEAPRHGKASSVVMARPLRLPITGTRLGAGCHVPEGIRRETMPRVTVTADVVGVQDGDTRLLLDETVRGIHLKDEESSVQFLERLAWAIEDGERLERVTSPAAVATERWALAR